MDEVHPTTPQQRRRSARMRQIVDAATRIVVADGFDALSVQRLAFELDYTPGALYRYFESKEALMGAVVVGVIDDIAGGLAATAARHAAESAVIRLRALAESWLALANDEPNRFALIMMLMATPQLVLPDPKNARPAVMAMLKALGPVRAAIADATAAGLFRGGDPTQRALVLFAGLQGALLMRKQSHHVPGMILPQRVFHDVLETILAGWASAPVAGDAQEIG